nr:zinc-binding dehydrogenase [Myxococcota bacterium]
GVVDALGSGVNGLAPGDPVAVEPLATCGHCAICRRGDDSICPSCQLYGVHRPGGLAEYAVLPAARLFPVPRDLDLRVAALAEPMAVVTHGLRRAGFRPGQRVGVIGAGTVGLLTVAAAHQLGAAEVWATARHPHQAERARALGAAHVLGEGDAAPASLAAVGREAPVDIAVETVGGHANTLDAAGAWVRPGGAVSVLGVFLGPVRLETMTLLLKEVTLAWSYCYGRRDLPVDFDQAIGILAARRDAFAELVTHSVPLDEVGRAFALAADKGAGAVKVSVVP